MWEAPVIEVITPEPGISTCGGPGGDDSALGENII